MMVGAVDIVFNRISYWVVSWVVFVDCGNGFFKPNISTLVGGLYKDGDERRDSAFSIFYMGINLGAFLAPLVIGFLTDNIFAVKDETGNNIISYGYRYGFLAAAIGMFLGQIAFNMLAQKYLGDLGKKPGSLNSTPNADTGEVADPNKPLTKAEKQRIAVIFVYFLFAIFFFAGFEQAGSSLSLYTDKFIDKMFLDLQFQLHGFNQLIHCLLFF